MRFLKFHDHDPRDPKSAAVAPSLPRAAGPLAGLDERRVLCNNPRAMCLVGESRIESPEPRGRGGARAVGDEAWWCSQRRGAERRTRRENLCRRPRPSRFRHVVLTRRSSARRAAGPAAAGRAATTRGSKRGGRGGGGEGRRRGACTSSPFPASLPHRLIPAAVAATSPSAMSPLRGAALRLAPRKGASPLRRRPRPPRLAADCGPRFAPAGVRGGRRPRARAPASQRGRPAGAGLSAALTQRRIAQRRPPHFEGTGAGLDFPSTPAAGPRPPRRRSIARPTRRLAPRAHPLVPP